MLILIRFVLPTLSDSSSRAQCSCRSCHTFSLCRQERIFFWKILNLFFFYRTLSTHGFISYLCYHPHQLEFKFDFQGWSSKTAEDTIYSHYRDRYRRKNASERTNENEKKQLIRSLRKFQAAMIHISLIKCLDRVIIHRGSLHGNLVGRHRMCATRMCEWTLKSRFVAPPKREIPPHLNSTVSLPINVDRLRWALSSVARKKREIV